MTDRELMQQALDLLDDINQCSLPPTGIPLPAEIDHVMEALRARLAQPEEPVAQVDYNERGNICWLFGKQVPDKTLLYTAPPQSEWQNAALRLGEELSTVGPDGYYNMSASEWLDWAMKHITPARIEQEPVAKMREMLEVQGRDGNWNYDAYMQGMYNGMEFMVALAEGRDPVFRGPPEKWVDPPPQREWQGLTDEELSLLWVNYHGDNCLADGRILSYEQAIQAKLKEKHEKF